MTLGAGFVRVSTGSQDEQTQVKAIESDAADRGLRIVKWFKLHGYQASSGMQEPALREAVADIQRGDYATLIVTDSSRLDRREDLDAQAAILLAIRSAGGDVISIDEPQFGKTDFAGRLVTLVAQHANAQKSRAVKDQTFRGIQLIMANGGHCGLLPAYWRTSGAKYAKQAHCIDPASVRDIYARVADDESISSVARRYDKWPRQIRDLIRFEANHTGVIECSYTYDDEIYRWTHKVQPVVDSPMWWRANRRLDANIAGTAASKAGRPVARPANWLSGVLDCPECGGSLYMGAGLTPSGNPRIPKLRCGGHAKQRVACGRFKGCEAQPVIDAIEGIFSGDTTPILAFQRVAGNSHELETLKAELSKLQARLSATEDDDELDRLVTERKAMKARIEAFTVVPDSFDYAPTGQTVADMWNSDDKVKRSMARAIRGSWGLVLDKQNSQWGIKIGTSFKDVSNAEGIVDLGNGLCFRRDAA